MTTGYPDSYYHRTVTDHEPRPRLEGQQVADVCIVGAGLAGLTTAWELLKRGKTVAVVESNRVGWGASGRNGGFVSPGWSEGLSALENKLGFDHVRKLFALSVEGADMVRANLDELNIPRETTIVRPSCPNIRSRSDAATGSLRLDGPSALHPTAFIDIVNVEVAIAPSAGPEETVESSSLIHQFGSIVRFGRGGEEANGAVHAVSPQRDNVADFAAEDDFPCLLKRR